MPIFYSQGTVFLWTENEDKNTGSSMAAMPEGTTNSSAIRPSKLDRKKQGRAVRGALGRGLQLKRAFATLTACGPEVGTAGRSIRLCPTCESRGS